MVFFLALTYIQLLLGVCRGVRGVGQVFTHTQKKNPPPYTPCWPDTKTTHLGRDGHLTLTYTQTHTETLTPG